MSETNRTEEILSSTAQVYPTATIFSQSVNDKDAMEDLCRLYGISEKDAFKVTQAKFPKEGLKANGISNPFSEMNTIVGRFKRKHVSACGFSLKERGWWLIPSAMQPRIEREMARAKDSFENAKNVDLPLVYDRMVAIGRAVYSGAGSASVKCPDYPDLDVAQAACDFVMRVRNTQTAEALPPFVGESLRDQQREIDEIVLKRSQEDLFRQVVDHIRSVADAWSKPDGKVYDSTLDSLRDILAISEHKNLTNNQDITNLVTDTLGTLESVDISAVRANASLRTNVGARLGSVATNHEMGARRIVTTAPDDSAMAQ